jgi:hypothetical protein
MSRWNTAYLLLATLATWASSELPAFAQVPRYTPPGGRPLPAALDYFRQDVGVMDPYNTFVAPRRQLNNQLNAITARETADFQRAQGEIAAVRKATVAPTGVSAGFMNYSHYYPRSTAARPQARR